MSEDRSNPPRKPDRLGELIEAKTRNPEFWAGLRQELQVAIFTKNLLEEHARRDLTALGVDPSPAAVEAFWNEFIPQRSLLDRDLGVAFQRCREVLRAADASHFPYLPRQLPEDAESNPSDVVLLNGEEFDDWLRAALATVECVIFHERALAARLRYVRLNNEPVLPSKLIFLEQQDRLLRAWRDAHSDSHEPPFDRITGLSAAAASKCQLVSLRHQLDEADKRLLPRGSYLSKRAAPRQLRLRNRASVGLRKALGTRASKLAAARSIAATYAIFAPDLMPMPVEGGIKAAAVNAIERERQRTPPEVVAQVEEIIERTRKLREFLE